jgi:hypothetical protein
LEHFLDEQTRREIERIAVPGVFRGEEVRLLLHERVVPVLRVPVLRCCYSWRTAALVSAVCGAPPQGQEKGKEREPYNRKVEMVTNFLQRCYHACSTRGLEPKDRALVYAATNALNAGKVCEEACKSGLELHGIAVEASTIGPPGQFDVVLRFFDPENLNRAARAFRYCINVGDLCPTVEGEVRAWSEPLPR